MITVNRVYEKRATDTGKWNGRIGATELVIAAVDENGRILQDIRVAMFLDGGILPDASAQYQANFSLQSLQDAYAGAESLDEAKGNWGKKRDALIAGEIGVRSGEGVSTFTSIARQIVRAQLKKANGAKSEAWVAFTAKSDAEQNAVLDAKIAAASDAFRAAIAEEVTARANEAARKRALIDTTIV